MKKQAMMLFVCLLSSMSFLFAQDGGRFSAVVSKETVLMGNTFNVKFIVENLEDAEFTAPIFEDFQIVQGPSQSSMITMVNGNYSRKIEYSYYLEPKTVGEFFIPPAKVATKEGDVFTEPLAIQVVDNPDGIIEKEQPAISTFGFQMSPDDFGGINIQDFFTRPEGLMQDFGFDIDSLSNLNNFEFNSMEDLFRQFQGGIPGIDLEKFFQQLPEIDAQPGEEPSTKTKKRKIYKL